MLLEPQSDPSPLTPHRASESGVLQGLFHLGMNLSKVPCL